MSYGIKETKEMLGFILSLGNALGSSLEDGDVTLGDVTNFIGPMMEISDAFSGASEIKSELRELDESERAELLAYAKEKFSIPEKSVEEFVESAFDTIAQLHILVQKFKSLSTVSAV